MALITTITRLPPEATRLQRSDAVPAVARVTPPPLADVAAEPAPTPDRLRTLSRRFARRSLDAIESMSGSLADGLQPADAGAAGRAPGDAQDIRSHDTRSQDPPAP